MKEVFKINQGNYNKENNYWKSYSIIEKINLMNDPEYTELNKKVKKINEIYSDLSDLYQKLKSKNNIPLN